MTISRAIIFVAMLLLIAGCKNEGAEPAAEPTTAEPAATADSTKTPTTAVEAKTKGTKHDPPIALEKVPDGHWYCDMGKAHYTGPTKGDGDCPVCGMGLKMMDHAAMGHPHGEAHMGDDHHMGDDRHMGDDHHHE